MREILISIQPQWVGKILNGEKTIEIRKTMPKCELPCKVYIYCTQGQMLHDMKIEEYWNGKRFAYGSNKSNNVIWSGTPFVNGKVVAEFTLNKVDFIKMPANLSHEFLEKSCLNGSEIMEYLGGNFYKDFYAWHIDNLKIYDKPKLLQEFFKPCGDCDKKDTDRCIYEDSYCKAKVIKPPQSWCYVQRCDL